jgi:hypothetical protein
MLYSNCIYCLTYIILLSIFSIGGYLKCFWLGFFIKAFTCFSTLKYGITKPRNLLQLMNVTFWFSSHTPTVIYVIYLAIQCLQWAYGVSELYSSTIHWNDEKGGGIIGIIRRGEIGGRKKFSHYFAFCPTYPKKFSLYTCNSQNSYHRGVCFKIVLFLTLLKYILHFTFIFPIHNLFHQVFCQSTSCS